MWNTGAAHCSHKEITAPEAYAVPITVLPVFLVEDTLNGEGVRQVSSQWGGVENPENTLVRDLPDRASTRCARLSHIRHGEAGGSNGIAHNAGRAGFTLPQQQLAVIMILTRISRARLSEQTSSPFGNSSDGWLESGGALRKAVHALRRSERRTKT